MFATTASRDRQLQEAFTALPTFERESRTTLTRLTEFADNTDPLVTQLRPAARELSPTLNELAALAPDLKAFFRDLDPLIKASRTGIPAAQRILEDLRPLLAQIDPAGRQLVPITDFLALYKSEITAFFANTVATTQARDISTRVHYLRTTNPFNLENLAVYPRRLGTNRTNPYMLPRGYDKLARGCDSFETRHCGRALPTISSARRRSVGRPGPRLAAAVDPGHAAASRADADPDADRAGPASRCPRRCSTASPSSCSRVGSGEGRWRLLPPAGSAGGRQHALSADSGALSRTRCVRRTWV